jgi:hypothetical protein
MNNIIKAHTEIRKDHFRPNYHFHIQETTAATMPEVKTPKMQYHKVNE